MPNQPSTSSASTPNPDIAALVQALLNPTSPQAPQLYRLLNLTLSRTWASGPSPDISPLLQALLNPTPAQLFRLFSLTLSQNLLLQIALLRLISYLAQPPVQRSIREWVFNNIPAGAQLQDRELGPTVLLLGKTITNVKKAVEYGMKTLKEEHREGTKELTSPDRTAEQGLETAGKILVGLEELMESLKKRYETASGHQAPRERK
ncbi:hypothetical protein ONS95_013525 [Cadophora gregata]|uniref:uncharacterized protein n=1 Tax=Cadophora gregata TaxID=51156 RepID=UPI0026DC8057|nr:uncharacterized protein ONS95_013525 [Cadophora gregata]KAK0116513.1 hypothetical protein ONS95_013525 [Cadophora gregata]